MIDENIGETIESLKELNTTKDKIISILAHDLKSQIGSISCIISYLATDYEKFTDDERKKLLITLNSSSEQVVNLLENTLFWAYSKLGRLEFDSAKYRIYEVINTAISELDDYSTRKNISIINQIPKNTIAFFDSYSITVAIKNILNNAVKFSHKGETVSISAEKSGRDILITISDNGIGMKKNQLKSLFNINLNMRASGTDEESGSGFGLLVSKEFIEKNNGKIQIESKYKQGTKVYISLPAK